MNQAYTFSRMMHGNLFEMGIGPLDKVGQRKFPFCQKSDCTAEWKMQNEIAYDRFLL